MHYAFSAGWTNVPGLARLTPQPAGGGQIIPEFEASSLGLSVAQGRPYTYLVYNYLSPADYISLLVQFGLSLTITSRKGTFKLRNHDDGTWIFRNAYINYPTGKRRLGHWENVVFVLTGLRELT